MRIRECDFAYDIEQVQDRLTQIPSKWQFKIVRLHPAPETVVSRGAASGRAPVEKKRRPHYPE